MQIKTLNNIDIEILTDTFNLAFSDYLVSFHLTKEELLVKMKMDKVDLRYSVGAYLNNKLVGFILHGIDTINGKRTVYNGGTGVIPSARGKKITKLMYNYILNLFYENGVDSVLLEVISSNTPAIRVYNSIGFKDKRTLKCYQGKIETTSKASDIQIKRLDYYNWNQLQNFWDITPTWQNSIRVANDTKEINVSLAAYRYDKLVGYLIFNPQNKRIIQISVDRRFRHQGIGSALIDTITKEYGNNLSIINVDTRAESTHTFLIDKGFVNHLNQIEMKLDLESVS